MGLKVDWKPIKDAEQTGLVYWLSGFKFKGRRRTKERWVDLGYWSGAAGSWVNQDLDDELLEPTHFAEHFMPDPPE